VLPLNFAHEPHPHYPRVLQLRSLAKKLGKLFPADKTVLDGLIPADPELHQRLHAIGDFFLVDTRGPPPGDGDTLIHVFIDHSNILIGLLTYLKRYPRPLLTHNSSSSVSVSTTQHPQHTHAATPLPSVTAFSFPPKPTSRSKHLSHAALALILERGRPITRRVLVTSSPLYQPMDTAERLGYEVRVYARVPDLGDGQDRVGSAGSGHGHGRQHSRSLSAGAGGLMGFTNGNGNANANANANGTGNANANGAGGVQGELPPLRNPRWGSNGNGGGGEANGNGNGGGGGRKRKGHVRRISGSQGSTSTESEQGQMMNGMAAAAAGFPQAFIRSLGGANVNGGGVGSAAISISTAMSPPSYGSSPISSSLPMSNGLHGFTPSPIAPTAGNGVSPPAKIKYREQGVDELLQLKLHQALAALDGPPPPGATIVLATGDGNVGQFNEDGFLGPVRTALKKGWRVELYAWEEGLSRAWMREFGEWTKPVEGEATGRFRVVGMEQFAGELLEIY
jgi:hypothetical protein